MPVKHVVRNGLLKTIQVDAAGNEINAAPAVRSTLADPNKALSFATNFDDANLAAQAAGTQLAPSTIQTLETVQSPEYLAKFGNPQVADTVIYDLMNQIFTKIQAPIGIANKLLILQNFNINIKIDDSGSMEGPRWNQAYNRLLEMMDILQVVPTGPVTLSFLDRGERITINRYGKTPAQFYQEVTEWLRNQFRRTPTGGTPIYRNMQSMLNYAQGQTAHFIITDGRPTGYGQSEENSKREIRDVKNLILTRPNPESNPITLMCCSTNPEDTEWMHEVEEIACRPGRTPGYVSALQNYPAERIEVLNDQGAWLPYTKSVWLICSLVASLNPNDLDALDQHAPLCKAIIDSFLGRLSTMTEYEGYFLQHPNATWLFKEDYQLFLKVPITSQIESVYYFEKTLGDKLDVAINNGRINTEFADIASTETMLLSQFRRPRPQIIYEQRQIFWQHYAQMELTQLQALSNAEVVSQHLWGDFIAYSNMGNIWARYSQDCHPQFIEIVQKLGQEQQMQQQQQVAAYQQAGEEGQEGEEVPPPPYDHNAITLSAPQYDVYSKPRYYNGYIQSAPVYNQSSSGQTLWTPPPQNNQQQYQGGYNQQYGNQQYRSSCCTLS